MGAEYGLRRVERPPVPVRGGGGSRKSALVRHVEEAMEEPGEWFSIATYESRTGAYGAANRLKQRKWPMPIVFWPVAQGQTSELFVRAIAPTTEEAPSGP